MPSRGAPTARCASATAASFPTKRLDRLQADGAPRGIRRADDPDPERECEAPREDAAGEVGRNELRRVAAAAEQLRCRKAEHEPERERAEADQHRLGDDEKGNPARRPADRAKNPDLANPL